MDRVKKILNLSQIPSIDVEDNAGIIAAVKNVNPELTGKSDAEQMSIIQWLVFSEKPLTKEDIIKLEDLISTRSYLVGERLSIADIAVVACLPFDTFAISDVPNIFRWFQHVTSNLRQGIISSHKLVHPIIPIPLPVDSNAGVQITKPTSIEREDKKIVVAENNNEPVATVTTSSSEELDPSKLDIRVGLVVKCWNHPDSEKLLCEEIDLGEGSNRLIASGIRAHYCAEDVQGKKVLVLSNLKERSIAGFKSQGMVLCASNQDHTIVRLLEPPEKSQVGDRVKFDGFHGEPATPAQIAKKKLFESLAPFLKTDSEGLARWKSAVLLVGGNPCKSPVPDAIVA